MSERNKERNGPITAFAVTVCFLIFALIGWYEGFKRGQESHQGLTAEAYTEQAEAKIQKTCFALPDTAQAECIGEAIGSAREQQRAEEDLDAQQQMAEWARWMLTATVVMGVITTLGVVFVWQTLEATRQMALDTRRIGEAQVRAYLTFSGSEVAYGSEDGPATYFLVRPRFKNTGQSPGMIVYAFCHIMFVDDLTSPIDYRVNRVSDYRTKLNVGPGEERWISAPPLNVEYVARAVVEKKTLLFLGCIEFTDIFDDARRSEDFCFKLDFHGDPAARCGHSWNTHQDYKVQVI
jgi:hypothetical protein